MGGLSSGWWRRRWVIERGWWGGLYTILGEKVGWQGWLLGSELAFRSYRAERDGDKGHVAALAFKSWGAGWRILRRISEVV